MDSSVPDEVKALEERVWRKLEAILDPQQLKTARETLPVHDSLFPFGKEEVTIEIGRPKGGGFEWRLSRPTAPGKGPFNSGAALPVEFARFWTPEWGPGRRLD